MITKSYAIEDSKSKRYEVFAKNTFRQEIFYDVFSYFVSNCSVIRNLNSRVMMEPVSQSITDAMKSQIVLMEVMRTAVKVF